MKNVDPLDNSDLKQLQLFFHLIPVLGFFPSLWTLYRHSGEAGEAGEVGEAGEAGEAGKNTNPNSPSAPLPLCPSAPLPQNRASREQLKVSRLSVTLALSWLMSYLLLNVGAETSEFLTLRLLLLNSLLTSGYFLISIWLMVRLAARKSLRLPGFSRWAERVMGKHLS